MTIIHADYVGYVFDRLGSLPTRKTGKYTTYFQAHEAAEKLSKNWKYGNRGSISVSVVERPVKKRFRNINEKWGDPVIFDSLKEMVKAINDSGYGPLKESDLQEDRDFEEVL